MRISSSPVLHDAFHVIDTPHKAYLIGFLLADGCVRNPTARSRFRISFRIKREDIKACRMLLDIAGGNLRIIENGYRSEWDASSDAIAADLIALGVTPRKTLTAALNWEAIPASLHGAVLAGLIDGDGHLRIDRKARRMEISLVTASATLRDQLLERFPFFKSTVRLPRGNRKRALYKVLVETNRDHLATLIRAAYDDLPFQILDRKQGVLDLIRGYLSEQDAYDDGMARVPSMKASGMTLEEIAGELGTSIRPVLSRLKAEGIVSKKAVFTAEDREEMRRLHEQGKSPRQIHKAIGRGTEQAVRFHLNRMGCRRKVSRDLPLHENTDEILRLNRLGQPAYRIAEELGMDVGVVRRVLRVAGIELHRGSAMKLTPDLVLWADGELEKGRTLRSVAEELGVSGTLIRLRRRALLETRSALNALSDADLEASSQSIRRG